jgi:hypothetical protein
MDREEKECRKAIGPLAAAAADHGYNLGTVAAPESCLERRQYAVTPIDRPLRSIDCRRDSASTTKIARGALPAGRDATQLSGNSGLCFCVSGALQGSSEGLELISEHFHAAHSFPYGANPLQMADQASRETFFQEREVRVETRLGNRQQKSRLRGAFARVKLGGLSRD